jgi:hypothetical protein
MTSDQPPPDTCGRLDGLLPPGSVVTVTGPWTVRSCVTAACTGCGAVPLDEDTSTTPHFDDTSQAAQELAQNWGWHHQRGTWPKDDVLLCPVCAAQPPRVRTDGEGAGFRVRPAPVTPVTDPDRFTEREKELFDAGLCCWQTRYGLPRDEYCAEPSQPGADHGYCARHAAEAGST